METRDGVVRKADQPRLTRLSVSWDKQGKWETSRLRAHIGRERDARLHLKHCMLSFLWWIPVAKHNMKTYRDWIWRVDIQSLECSGYDDHWTLNYMKSLATKYWKLNTKWTCLQKSWEIELVESNSSTNVWNVLELLIPEKRMFIFSCLVENVIAPHHTLPHACVSGSSTMQGNTRQGPICINYVWS